MLLAQSLGVTRGRMAAFVGVLALPLLAGCAYDGAYYDSGYYDDGYGYGYGGAYGYGGYGYYGSPCWPYGCDDWGHRHHRHHHWDDDDNNDPHHHHHHGGSAGMPGSIPPRTPGSTPPAGPSPQVNNVRNRNNTPMIRSPEGAPVWIPQRDSKN
jgi:hypothetical protein